MEDDVVRLLLNDMPVNEFKSWFILAMAGALVYLIFRILIVLGPLGPKSPQFSWKMFASGFLKLMVTLILAPWIILYFDVIAPFVFEFLFDMGTEVEGEHNHITMELNGLSAFATGFSIDFITHRAMKKYMIKKNGHNGTH